MKLLINIKKSLEYDHSFVDFSEYKNFIFHISKSFSSRFPIEAQFVAKTVSNSIQIEEKLVI